MASRILLIHGPNLNLLGTREPEKYGTNTLASIEADARSLAASLGATLDCFQSNIEGEIINKIHETKTQMIEINGEKVPKYDFLIINAGAFTHTSVAIRDAILGVELPLIEVHITNVHAREAFRHVSYLSDIAVGCIVGLGVYGYKAAVEYAVTAYKPKKP